MLKFNILLNFLDDFLDFFDFDPGEFIASLIYHITNGMNESMKDIFDDLLIDLSDFATEQIDAGLKVFGDTSIVYNIYSYLLPVGYSLLALFFVIEFVKRTAYLEVMTLENTMKPVLMLVVGKIVIDNSRIILKYIYNISTSLTNGIYEITNVTKDIYDPESANIEGLGLTLPKVSGDDAAREALISFFGVGVCFLMILFMIVAISIIAIVFVVRKVEISILVCLSPMFFATLMGNVTNDIFKSYIKYFIAVCFQTIIIAICIVMLKSDMANFMNLGGQGKSADAQLDIASVLVILLQMIVLAGFAMGAKPALLKWMGK